MRAVAFERTDMANLVLRHALAAARRVIEEAERLELPVRDSQRVLDALENSPAVSVGARPHSARPSAALFAVWSTTDGSLEHPTAVRASGIRFGAIERGLANTARIGRSHGRVMRRDSRLRGPSAPPCFRFCCSARRLRSPPPARPFICSASSNICAAANLRVFRWRSSPVTSPGLGERVVVRYDRATAIFDPENYERSLERSGIGAGSHLHVIVAPDPVHPAGHYRVPSIWKGDGPRVRLGAIRSPPSSSPALPARAVSAPAPGPCESADRGQPCGCCDLSGSAR